MVIKFYGHKGTLGYLSNFYPAEITLNGRTWPTSEHFYQAMKTLVEAEQEKIRQAGHPAAAKKLGKGVKVRPDWDAVKENIMLEGLRAKFTQHPDLAEKLLSTGTEELVENSPTDSYWGYRLGHLLMKVRSELRGDNAPVPVPGTKELKMYKYNSAGTDTPIRGIIFISRPVTTHGGMIAAGPTSRYFPHKSFSYTLMQKDRCHLGLENFAVFTRDGKEPELRRRVTGANEVSIQPFGALVFAAPQHERVGEVRKAVLQEFAHDHPNGGFVWVGAALLTKVLEVGRERKLVYSFYVKEAVWVAVPLSHVTANNSKDNLKGYTDQFFDWLDENFKSVTSKLQCRQNPRWNPPD